MNEEKGIELQTIEQIRGMKDKIKREEALRQWHEFNLRQRRNDKKELKRILEKIYRFKHPRPKVPKVQRFNSLEEYKEYVEKRKDYYLKNRERFLQHQKKYYLKNRDKINEKRRERYQKNKLQSSSR